MSIEAITRDEMAGLGLDDQILLKRIDQLTLRDELVDWKAIQVDDTPRIRTERAVAAAESWKRTRGEDLQLRRARLLAHILEKLPVHMHAWQLLAGSATQDIYGVHPDIDLCTTLTQDAMNCEFLPIGSPEVAGMVTEEEKQILLEGAEVFRGDTVC